MPENREVLNLLSELENVPDIKTVWEIVSRLKPYADSAVDLITQRLLKLDKPIDDLTEADWLTRIGYILSLSEINTEKALQGLIDAMFVYTVGNIDWNGLIEELSLNAHLMTIELSEAIIKAQGREGCLQLELSSAFLYGLRDNAPIQQPVIENMLTIYQGRTYAPIAWLYSIIRRIVRETQDMRFLQPSLQLFSSEESDLRWMAIEVLSEFDHDHIIMEIFPMLEDRNEIVRQKAKEALLKAGFNEE